ncbi:MAG: EutN/CcmL family microcompartment protein [Planctomycetia bacterium]|nr:EutN/CcmL family microcompartment protein [Planctomycetia bacterium]
MFIAKVVGSVVSTQKTATMVGHRLLLIEPYVIDPQTRNSMVTTSRSLVAVDTVGAGENEFVLVVQGSSARMTPETKPLPVDATVVGIVDSVHIERKPIAFQ